MKPNCLYVSLVVLILMLSVLAGADDYQDFGAISSQLSEWSGAAPELLSVTSIGSSVSGNDLWLARIALPGAVDPDKRQAVFIGANIEGNRLLSTAVAMKAIKYCLDNKDSENMNAVLTTRTLYVAPVMNPDVMIAYMSRPASERKKNNKKVNDDLDLEADEDGPEDLNGDGFITQMRYKDPQGTMIPNPDDPRFMKKADPMKGEEGIFKIISEGIDNDNDGKINEDGPGGVILNMNFPHDFQYYKNGAGRWPASEPETVAFLNFMIKHRNIALVYMFGSESNLLNLQKGKQARGAGAQKVKVPRRFASFLGLDPEQEYDLDELVEMINASPMLGGQRITKEQVLIFLGTGPVMSISDSDYKYYEEISRRYKAFVKEHGIDDEARKPKPVMGDGSFVTWTYYHFGVPSFSVDLWAVPKPKAEKKENKDEITAEKLKEMSKDDFLALGEEKIDAFIKSRGMESRMSASRLMDMVRQGMVTPQQMAQMMERMGGGSKNEIKEGEAEESYILKWAETNIDGGGFVPWTKFDHPQLGEVEIGGMKPGIKTNPPFGLTEKLLEPNAEFAINLANDLAEIAFQDVSVKKLSDGIFEVTAFVVNKGFFPTSMRQGQTNRKVLPVIVTISADQKDLVSGKKIVKIDAIAGKSKSSELRWIVRKEAGSKISIIAMSQKSGNDEISVELK